MAIYVDRDVYTTFEGDLELDQKGDLKLADSLETYKSVANFILRSDFGSYSPAPNVGSNLGSYIGQTNTRDVHENMETSITNSLAGKIFALTDVGADVVPMDINEALCFVNLAGTFLVSGELITVEQDRLTYSFPYIDGEPTPLVISNG